MGDRERWEEMIKNQPRPADIDYAKYTIGGMSAHCYSHTSARNSKKPAVILFLTHMRTGAYIYMQPIAYKLLQEIQLYTPTDGDVYIVSFDHRNHGERKIDEKANKTWEEGNETHAIDMYSLVYGASQDISMLIDFLPSYLFPQGRAIKRWGLIGVSMGGHSSWIAMAKDPRLSIGCFIVGCPAYLELVLGRAQASKIPIAPPYFPDGFVDTVKRTYAGSVPYTSKGQDNPFLGKKIFAQIGGADQLIPYNIVVDFLVKLEVGQGVKEMKNYPEVGHDYPDVMVKDSARFIARNL